MSTFEDQGYEWRETYFVLFESARRPMLEVMQVALSKINPRFRLGNLDADEVGRFASLTLQSPDDYAALDISYMEGDEVREQVAQWNDELRATPLDKEDRAKLAQLNRCDARFDVLHFEQKITDADNGDEDQLDEMLDPGALLIALDVLIELTHGVGYDPQSGSFM